MSQSEPSSTQNNFNISGSSITNLTGSGSIYYNEAIIEAQKQSSQASSQQLIPEPASDKASVVKTILFLAANPQGTSQLRLQEEAREIDAGLQRAKRRDQFVLEQKWAVRARDIQRAMLDFKPQIVHFSGHGGGEEGLVLENKTGNIKFVDAQALAGLFELFSLQVECVILNACYSEVQAEAIIHHIPYVIGMNKAIGDRAAIEFAVGFYDALGAGESVEFAYKFGCSSIRMAGIAEHLTPILNKKSS
ncbi:MAG: CHAT domain-containing protein [Aulosira sp. DedQUE10]|nr:CHAT domain-containing protein [Aulosira sp. DedQUE10]